MKSLTAILVFTIAIAESSIAFQCAQPNGFYIHPSNAHKFIRCVDGRAFEYDCSNMLVWNKVRGQCDWTSGPVITDPGQPVNANGIVATREQHLNCLQQNGFFIHPNPHRFFRCVNGYDHEFVCPVDLVWNQHKTQCDYTNGYIEPIIRPIHPETPKVIIHNADQLQHCPSPNGYFAHSTNPLKFLLCINGLLFEYYCAADLVWNIRANACDYISH